MKVLHAILAVAVAGTSTTALAARWVLVEIAKDQTVYFLDTSKLTSTQERTYWVKRIRKTVDYDGEKSAVVRYAFDCKNDRLAALSITTYKTDGNVINSLDRAEPMRIAIPDSIGESLLRVACQSKNTLLGKDVIANTDGWAELYHSPPPPPEPTPSLSSTRKVEPPQKSVGPVRMKSEESKPEKAELICFYDLEGRAHCND